MSAADILMGRARDSEPKASVIQTRDERLERMPWVEKYRPKNLDEVSSQSNTVQVLKKNLQTANLPHMLFYGPPGTGKTSTILAMAKELYGPSLFKSRVLELNASDERGISIVRDKIKNFARLSISNPTKEDLAKYPCPPYKLIILDEADSMTSDAQSALRRTMETYSNITRFCLVCNYITRIIDPLASRCSKFRFKMLDQDNSLGRLQYIAQQEHLSFDNADEVLSEILRISDGDLRKAINFLQSLSKLLLTKDEDVEMVDADESKDAPVSVSSSEQIRELFGYLPNGKLNQLIQIVQSKNLNSIFNYLDLELFKNGYNGSLILTSLHDRLLLGGAANEADGVDLSLSLDNKQKNKISRVLFETDVRLSNGCEESLQILNCMLQISTII